MAIKRRINELGKLWEDKHNDLTLFENYENFNRASLWLHKHPKIHGMYKRLIYGLYKRNWRLITSPFRVFPDFIIIGCQKCGTTSLYDYIIKHPCVYPATHKEIHFFDTNYKIGLNWYRSYFPTIFEKYYVKKIHKKDFVTGEASPMYIFDTRAPKRISQTIPKLKLIAILRNPIDRAYSHYNMQVRNDYETLSFEEAIKAEEKRLAGEREKEASDEHYISVHLRDHSYLERGIYVDQLKIWMHDIAKKQFLILTSEELDNNLTKVLDDIFEFLGIPKYNLKNLEKANVGMYKEINTETRKFLTEYFKPHNERLYKFLGRKFDWDNDQYSNRK